MQHLRRALTSPGALRALASASLRAPALAECPQAGAVTLFRTLTTSSPSCSPAAEADKGSDAKRAVSRSAASPPVHPFPIAPSSSRPSPLAPQNINRLLYRARQRGWLELDLLVGMWTERHIGGLAPQGLADLETLLNQVRCLGGVVHRILDWWGPSPVCRTVRN